jgi:hypothetical protein
MCFVEKSGALLYPMKIHWTVAQLFSSSSSLQFQTINLVELKFVIQLAEIETPDSAMRPCWRENTLLQRISIGKQQNPPGLNNIPQEQLY